MDANEYALNSGSPESAFSMYPFKQASELTQEQKQVVSALGQLAAQLSAGVASGSVEGGIQGAVAGKNAVENNTLGNDEEELQREHGNRPAKIISIKPAQAGIVDDEGSIRSVGGKVILPVAIKDLPATTGKAGTSSESGKDAKVVEPYIITSPIAVSGTRAIDKAQSYEGGLREKYGNVPYT